MAAETGTFTTYLRRRIEPYKTTTLGFLAGILGVAINLREAVSDSTVILALGAGAVAVGAGVFVARAVRGGRNPKWTCDLFMASALTAVIAGLMTVGQALTDKASGGNEPLMAILIPQLQSIDEGVSEIADNTAEIADNTAEIAVSTAASKREVSENPRKELANLGIAWTSDNFMEAIEARDFETMRLFLDGGMNIETASWQGMMLPVVLGRTKDDIPEILGILSEYDFDPNYAFGQGSNRSNDRTIIGWAAQIDRPDIIKAAVKIGADPNQTMNSLGALGMTSVQTPLVAAADHGKFAAGLALLEAGADPSADEWLVYARLQHRLYRYELERENKDAQRFLKALKPPKKLKRAMDLMTELSNVEGRISKMATDNLTNSILGTWNEKTDPEFQALERRRVEIEKELTKLGY